MSTVPVDIQEPQDVAAPIMLGTRLAPVGNGGNKYSGVVHDLRESGGADARTFVTDERTVSGIVRHAWSERGRIDVQVDGAVAL